MDESIFAGFFVAAVSLAVVSALIIRWRLRKRRQARIRRVGAKIGLHPVYHPDEALSGIWRERFLLLNSNRNIAGRGAQNLLKGVVQRHRVYLFDYEASVGRETSAWQSVIAIENETPSWPKFALHPQKLKRERFTQRWRTALQEFAAKGMCGYRRTKITIDGYQLSAPASCLAQVRDLFGPEVVAYFSNHRRYALEGGGNFLLLYSREHLISPHNLETFVEDALSIRELLASSTPVHNRRPVQRRRQAAGNTVTVG